MPFWWNAIQKNITIRAPRDGQRDDALPFDFGRIGTVFVFRRQRHIQNRSHRRPSIAERDPVAQRRKDQKENTMPMPAVANASGQPNLVRMNSPTGPANSAPRFMPM